MTKTLTEQWREGTLPDGYYYIVSKWSGKTEINDYYEGCWQDLREEYIKQVLAPVPSYDEWRAELASNDELLTVQKRLEKKLAIATKAFEELEIKSDKLYRGDNDWSMVEQLDFIKAKCQETLYHLKEMEGVK